MARKKKHTPTCLSCRWWDNADDNVWGICTLSDPDNHYDEQTDIPIRARTVNSLYESVVETRSDFSCSQHEPLEPVLIDQEEWW